MYKIKESFEEPRISFATLPEKISLTRLDQRMLSNYFFRHLEIEKLRAQRTGSPLSIALLRLKQREDGRRINLLMTLEDIRKETRLTDICGFINQNTIGVLFPHTDETGAKETCAKLLKGKGANFSTTISTYPDHIFESLIKDECIQADAFPFEIDNLKNTSCFQLLIKRSMDIVGSVIGLIALLPIMLPVALAIKTTSPGPVIFTQKRLGSLGVPFTFYKFRSMYVNTNDQTHREYIKKFINGEHAEVNHGNEENPLYKMASDSRITKIGAFIRKTSIDELPQLFNVLKGEMSLVGPRPPLAYEVQNYQAWHLMRLLDMKPGITGLWQVEGRGRAEWNDSVRLDIQYIQNWSLMLDLKILIKTVMEVLRCKGAV